MGRGATGRLDFAHPLALTMGSMIGWIAWALLVLPAAFLVYSGRAYAPFPPVVGLQLAGAVLALWARVVFGLRSFHAGSNPTAGGLVTTGPYRFVRHPIYAGMLLMLAGALVAHHDAVSFACAAGIALGLAVRMAAEEREVARAYPEYAAYAQRVRRLIPFVF